MCFEVFRGDCVCYMAKAWPCKSMGYVEWFRWLIRRVKIRTPSREGNASELVVGSWGLAHDDFFG